jgi:hypothetical protein
MAGTPHGDPRWWDRGNRTLYALAALFTALAALVTACQGCGSPW